jgi:CRP-like cAMP-binding protein
MPLVSQLNTFATLLPETRTDFYMVTHVEVEVLDGAAKDPEHAAIAVLGPGSFFGEKSLLNTEPASFPSGHGLQWKCW